MPGDPDIAAVAAVVGEPTRARILMALLDGRRLPASELTRICGTAKSTASEHLRTLFEYGFVKSEKCGRHTYYWLADPSVAHALEAMAGIAPRTNPTSLSTVRRHDALAGARLCYDHLAGHLGVTVTDALSRTGLLHLSPQGQLLVDCPAWDARRPLGITTSAVAGRRQLTARTGHRGAAGQHPGTPKRRVATWRPARRKASRPRPTAAPRAAWRSPTCGSRPGSCG
jgi:DNA-binding transcriptional ArsR family regulator